MENNQTAVFGGGCFWCMEAIFLRVKGVEKVEPGYAGGKIVNPTYQQVCTGTTGHAEVIRITFNPDIISLAELIKLFWYAHDPTTLNRQGNDAGTQYRSIILYQDDEQKVISETEKKIAEDSGEFDKPIVTTIESLKEFYPAERYHLDYFAHNPNQPYCRTVIAPKVQHFLEKYKELG